MRFFQGVLFDIIDEVIFERACTLRASYAEALADAQSLLQFHPERACEADCFVLSDEALLYSADEAEHLL